MPLRLDGEQQSYPFPIRAFLLFWKIAAIDKVAAQLFRISPPRQADIPRTATLQQQRGEASAIQFPSQSGICRSSAAGTVDERHTGEERLTGWLIHLSS